MSSKKNITASIALSKLKHVRMERKGKSGMIKGIFIPIEANKLIEGKEGAVYVNLNVIYKAEKDEHGNNGFISKSVDSEVYKSLKDSDPDELKSLTPILGNLKEWTSNGSNDSTGAVSNEVYSDDDDLPF